MNGRVLYEAMAGGDPGPPSGITSEVLQASTAIAGGERYRMEVRRSAYRGVIYFDQARGWRE